MVPTDAPYSDFPTLVDINENSLSLPQSSGEVTVQQVRTYHSFCGQVLSSY